MGERGEGRGRRVGGVGGGVAVFEGWGIVDGEFEGVGSGLGCGRQIG